MRTPYRVRAAVAAAGLLVVGAALAGCSSTVDGMATCPGCGTNSEPDFPTPRPTAPNGTPSIPTAAPGDGTLEPDATGLVFIETRSGATRCQISADTVGCESEFTEAPTIDGEQANGVEVSATGDNRWVLGNLGAIPTVSLDYATYYAVGWTIDAGTSGTRFTNDDTGHGMFVSTERVEFF